MKRSFICSFVLILTIATGLYSKPVEKGQAKSIKSADLTDFQELKCKALALDDSRSSSRPMILNKATKETTSFNWSGYVALTKLKHPESHSVSKVSGAWVAPFLLLIPTPISNSVAIWVGIDGFAANSPTVEQIGTVHTMSNNIQTNYAFFEIAPGPASELVGFPVNPGDLMGAEVVYIGHNKFFLYMINFTLKVFTRVAVHAPGVKRNSAEWIVEAPSVGNAIQPLALFSSVPFFECAAKIDGEVGTISDDDWTFEPIVMVSETTPTPGVTKAAPSKLRKHGTEFVVDWLSKGP